MRKVPENHEIALLFEGDDTSGDPEGSGRRAGSSPKRFFARHAKSSAVLVTLAVHGLLFVAALSFIVFTVVPEEAPQSFNAQRVNRQRIQPRKISIPVNIRKKKVRASAMGRQAVFQRELQSTAVELPKMTGVMGGMGYLGAGAGLGGLDAGFDIDFFGILGGGSHVVFIIDYSISMQGEKEGIMRAEVARIIRGLSRETQFAVIFFSGPAWDAGADLDAQMNYWVRSGDDPFSFRPKDWNHLPKIRYRQATRLTRSRLIKTVETTPLAWGTVYDNPIYMALNMEPMPDTIFFMTDGECAEDRGIISLWEMVDQLRAAGKKIPVMHTVGFGIYRNCQLEEMAKLTGGECQFLTAREYVKKHGPQHFRRSRTPRDDVFSRIQSVPPDQHPVHFPLQ